MNNTTPSFVDIDDSSKHIIQTIHWIDKIIDISLGLNHFDFVLLTELK